MLINLYGFTSSLHKAYIQHTKPLTAFLFIFWYQYDFWHCDKFIPGLLRVSRAEYLLILMSALTSWRKFILQSVQPWLYLGHAAAAAPRILHLSRLSIRGKTSEKREVADSCWTWSHLPGNSSKQLGYQCQALLLHFCNISQLDQLKLRSKYNRRAGFPCLLHNSIINSEWLPSRSYYRPSPHTLRLLVVQSGSPSWLLRLGTTFCVRSPAELVTSQLLEWTWNDELLISRGVVIERLMLLLDCSAHQQIC